MTRNPLSDPGILGINAGAGFALALVLAFAPGMPYQGIIALSFVGAALGTTLVYGLGVLTGGKGATPVRLVLAGAAVNTFLLAITSGIAIYFHISDDLTFWTAGGLSGIAWEQVDAIWLWIAAALLGAIALSRSITLLSLGDDIAVGLGSRTGLIKLLGAGLVLVLAGTAVSAVGSLAFIGLVIPHIARKLTGSDYRWIIPCSAVLGSLLVLFADVGARMINPPYEAPTASLIALIGVPFFLYLARKSKGAVS